MLGRLSLVLVSRGSSLVAVCRFVIAVASLVAEQGLGMQTSTVAAPVLLERRLNSRGTQA